MILAGYMKLIAASTIPVVIGVFFGLIIFPYVMKSQIKKEMSLSPKTDVRKMWEKVPFAIDFRIFVFNYTNAEEVQNGSIPIVKEIGPYYFEEWKQKVQVEDDDSNDTVSFRRQDTFIFRPDLSNGLTGEEEVIVPNVFLLSLSTLTLREKPAMMKVLAKALNGIYDNPSSVFMTVKVMDLLFRGVTINCDRNDFSSKAVCTTLKKEAANALVFEPGNQFKFSFFGMANNTPGHHILTVKRGTKQIKDVGKVVAVDGKSKQTVWEGHCNDIEGTDGTIFAPYLSANDRLTGFSEGFCRSFKPWFQRKSKYNGIKTNRYISNVGDFSNDPELKCYCKDSDSCSKGLMDVSPCTKAPLYISLPHFYDCDPKLLQNVKGLTPNMETHSQFLEFEPVTGSPLEARLGLMFSLQLIKSDKFNILENLPNTISPLFWVEEKIELDKSFTNVLKKQLFKPMKIVKVLSWLLIAGGMVGIITGVVLYFRASTRHSDTKIDPEKITTTVFKMPTDVTS